MEDESTHRDLTREQFLRGTAGLVAAGTGMGLLVPSALAKSDIKRGGILVYAYTDTSAAETTDPTVQTGIAVSQPPLQNTYERLTYVVPNIWKVVPQLAVSWKASPDAKTWTFKLRPGVKFHNGKPLDSKDVKWSYSHILDAKNGSSAYARLADELDPSGIKTPRADTVVFHLKKPDAQFPIFAGQYQAGIYPAGLDPKKDPIGTGPFMIKSWKPTQGWQIVRNPNYWRKGIPYLDGVRGIYIADPNTKVQAVVSGSASLSDSIPGTQIASLKKNPKVRLYVLAGGVSPDYSFDATQEPFTDPRVAQAIKIAVNRNTLLNAGFQGYGSLVGDVPELTIDPFYPRSRGVPAQNVAQAKALLQAAGKTDVSFTLTTADVFAGEVDMATALAQVVAPAGIHITIEKFPTDTFWSDAWLKKPAFTSWWNHRHPREILTLLYRSNAKWNEGKFNSPKVDKLMDAGAATLNPAKQRAIFRQALNEVALNSGVGISYFVNKTHVAKKNLNGVAVDPVYHLILDKAWLA
ncbi:MAG: ABC transporter substrate-binding protein [Actinobacteria bacterium]|nr:MAG: ABC transporter substrate-binding protein [Actinomycetota bacterium]